MSLMESECRALETSQRLRTISAKPLAGGVPIAPSGMPREDVILLAAASLENRRGRGAAPGFRPTFPPPRLANLPAMSHNGRFPNARIPQKVSPSR